MLYLGAASGTTVSHVSDIVGPVRSPCNFHLLLKRIILCVSCLDEVDCLKTGLVYAVEFSHRSGRDLVNMAKKRTNVIPIIEDARHPAKYRMLVGMVDVIFSDVAQPDQVYPFTKKFYRTYVFTVLLTVTSYYCLQLTVVCLCATPLRVVDGLAKDELYSDSPSGHQTG